MFHVEQSQVNDNEQRFQHKKGYIQFTFPARQQS